VRRIYEVACFRNAGVSAREEVDIPWILGFCSESSEPIAADGAFHQIVEVASMPESLVEKIYEASFMPDLWPQTLEEIGDVLGAPGGWLTVGGLDVERWKCTPNIDETFAQMQRELLELAHAHIDWVILYRFISVMNSAQPNSLKPVLKRMCDLFALEQIERHKGWYIEHGAMSGVKSRAISKQVDKLCAEVRHEAVQLVDAFGIPDACLAAPIAL